VAQHLALIEDCGVRAHFTCLSSASAVKQIKEAKAQGLEVSADCSMHALHLTEMDIANFDANCHVYPPLRGLHDRQGLLAGLIDGTIDAICTDHRPLDNVAKLAPFGDTIPGMSTIDTFVALGLHLVNHQGLSLNKLIRAITYRPAHLFNLPTGTLSIGSNADICIVDPNRTYHVTDDKFYSSGKNSPFKGWELSGKVVMTLIGGSIVHEV
jgi:dihydroorotase